MKRILTLGDSHGRDYWESLTENDYDLFIFLGDYFDSFNISGVQQLTNFDRIINFKNDNPDKVILLFGNHEYHYYPSPNFETYSGYQFYNAPLIRNSIEKAINEGLLQIAFNYENLLFSHAGFTKHWITSNIENYEEILSGGKTLNKRIDSLVKTTNELLKDNPKAFEFTVGVNFSMYGDDITQSPLWVRPHSLTMDNINGVIQIVGHTGGDSIRISEDLIICDVNDNRLALEIIIDDNNNFSFNQIVI